MSTCFEQPSAFFKTVTATLLLSVLAPCARAQPEAEAEVAARIVQPVGWFGLEPRGRIAKDDEGYVTSIVLAGLSDDADMESIDLKVFSRLKSVSMSVRTLSDRSLVHLRKTLPTDLQTLSISGQQSPITDKGLSLLLEKRTSLRGLMLVDVPLGERTLAAVGKLDSLDILFLTGPKIRDKDLKHLVGLQKLTILGLGNTAISDAGLEYVMRLTNLNGLDLDGTKVTDAGIQKLAVLQDLLSLRAFDTKVTERGKEALQSLLPGLKIRP